MTTDILKLTETFFALFLAYCYCDDNFFDGPKVSLMFFGTTSSLSHGGPLRDQTVLFGKC